MSTAFGDRFVVAVPAKAGETIEFYIKVSANREKITSGKFKAKLLPYKPKSATTKPTTKPKDG